MTHLVGDKNLMKVGKQMKIYVPIKDSNNDIMVEDQRDAAFLPLWKADQLASTKSG